MSSARQFDTRRFCFSRHKSAVERYTGWATAEVDGGGRDRLADIASRMNNVLEL